MNDTRYRVSADETAKGWRFAGTVEGSEDEVQTMHTVDGVVDVVVENLGEALLRNINQARKAFKDDGKILCEQD